MDIARALSHPVQAGPGLSPRAFGGACMTLPKMPKPLGLPITIPAAEALENLRIAAEQDAARRARRGAPSLFAEHLRPASDLPLAAPRSERDAAAGPAGPHPERPGPLLLEVTQIDGYDHNPRLFQNERYAEIESSLRQTGFHGSLVITRRPDRERYMLAAGSNTTLRILQRLWNETSDEKYRWVHCVVQPYTDEARLMAQHLGENLNRGEMRFWEVACGVGALLRMIEAQRRQHTPVPMTGREQVLELERRGIKADRTSLARWSFALERLAALQESTALLTNKAVDLLQPRLTALCNLASRFGVAQESFWSVVVDRTLEAWAARLTDGHSAALDAQALAEALEAALAAHLGESVDSIRSMLSQLRLSPRLTLAELRMPSPNLVVGRTPPVGALAVAQARRERQRAGQGPGQPVAQVAADPVAAADGRLPLDPPSASQAASPVPGPSTGASAGMGAPLPPVDAALRDLHQAVHRLLQAAQLEGGFRQRDDLPLGFCLEAPDPAWPEQTETPTGASASAWHRLRAVVWWTLVLSNGQLKASAAASLKSEDPFPPDFAAGEVPNPLEDAGIAQVLTLSPPDFEETQFCRLQPGPMGLAMQRLREFEAAAARVFEACPERWSRVRELAQSRA